MVEQKIICIAATAALLLGCAQQAPPAAAIQNMPTPTNSVAVSAADPSGGLTLETIRGVASGFHAGAVSTFFSTGYSDRAATLQRMIDDGASFFSDSLGTRPEINLAVLARSDWEKLSQVPYGIPFFSAASSIIFLPATLDGPIPDDYMAHRPNYSAASLAKIEASGLTFEEGARTMVDLIGYHELGHLFTRAYGIGSPSVWMNEFLATYFAYAFLHSRYPELASLFAGMGPLPAAFQPRHTSLQDFNRLYFGVGPENYFWYQGTFVARASELHAEQGLSFLRAVRDSFPVGTEVSLSHEQVLERLESIHPGFIAWSSELETGR